MEGTLVIEDGPIVELLGAPAQGTRHTLVFGVVAQTGQAVAVKLERMAGALARERAALALLGARDGPVPELIAAGRGRLGAETVECLVAERRPGAPPVTVDGWWRMGRAYARLADRRDVVSDPPAIGLPTFDRTAFGAAHAARVAELGERLAELAASIPDWVRLCSDQVPGSPPLVITHGDPGPGNFLDDGGDGSIIDWEEAQVAPRGLDLARMFFIALLGVGPSGYPARDHQARAEAVVAGYLEALAEARRPAGAQWRWWVTVAGVQIIHRRWELGGRPAPWQDAATVLRAHLGGRRDAPGRSPGPDGTPGPTCPRG